MKPISYKRHRFPPDVIRYAVWLYGRFTLSLRDVEDLLAERGIEVSYEAVRSWTRKFGRDFARNLRRSRPRPTAIWHLDEMVVRIGGNACSCGAPSTAKARCWTCWCRSAVTKRLR